ncbi:hypothetical protein F2P44_19605 [Massilia sp. CCM 8695]|uniref:Uncharacterized protein n=1 Tax=Massilia frigida TaxID=2609281 RepID=A0ABX0N7T5_9BURK|nr:hypothetical protein [Massilia frigida]NHZ81465.1 hypothetical protein [Massilia frigida]
MNIAFVTVLVLGLHARSGFARDSLECVLPQGGRIVMEAHCKAPAGVSGDCDSRYDTRYLAPGGGAPVELGETSLDKPDDSATPAAMCARFYARGNSVHAPASDDGQYRSIARGQVASVQAHRPDNEEVETQANRQSPREALNYSGYSRMVELGGTWVLEEAFTRRYRGHYADADVHRAPLSHVLQMQSSDQGDTWSAPVLTSASRLFTIGKPALDQPDAARPRFAPAEDKRRDRRNVLAQGKPLTMRCRLPDHSEFILSGKQPSDEELKREWGGERSVFVQLVSIAYVAAPGRAAIDVEPELSRLRFLADVPRPKLDEVCGTAGLANGVPYIGITMLDRDRKRFTQLTYPDKIWYPGELPRQINESLKGQDLTWGEQTEPPAAVTRRNNVLALEYPVVPEGCGGSDPRHIRPPVCTVSAVLRSESRDNGMSWSDLAFSTTSWIFAPGKPVDQQPGRATLKTE